MRAGIPGIVAVRCIFMVMSCAQWIHHERGAIRRGMSRARRIPRYRTTPWLTASYAGDVVSARGNVQW